jgi:hypothetical protein
MVVRNERGSLLIPFLLLTTILAFSGFGVWGVMRSWRKQAELQLTLDACVGKRAQELKSLLTQLTQSNTRMVWVRRSALAAVFLSPEALSAIRAELEVELVLQEGLRLKWQGEGAAAALGRSCEGLRVLPIRYPLLEWSRLPPDFIGPQAFEWDEPDPEFTLLFSASRHWSSARVAKVKNEQISKNHWIARWADLH